MSDQDPPRGTPRRGDASTVRMAAKTGPAVPLDLKTVRWVVVGGPLRGARFVTEGYPLTIGGGDSCSLVLHDETVSRRHAEVLPVGERLVVRDLGSRNGTFVDGVQINEAPLAPGCQLRCGSTVLEFVPASERVMVMPEQTDSLGELHGRSLIMRQLFGILKRVARTPMSVIILGETGVGKEVIARTLHAFSAQAAGPLMVLDASSLDPNLVSSELFGHEAGAFTGAAGKRQGVFELAKDGTVFLDEIGELPMDLQSKLLRVLEQREVRPLGGNRVVKVSCRVVAATHRNLKTMVAAGTFREDLFYRLAQAVVQVPPLRERREDIPLLVDLFLKRSGSPGQRPTLAPDALAWLMNAPLRGNVRELRNIVERAASMANGPRIELADIAADGLFSMDAPPETSGGTERPPPGLTALEAAERQTILETLRANHWHRTKAAAQLGVSLPTLRAKMRRYGLRVPERGEAPDA
jgi:DNA-binding NtrC family response regulator